MPKIPKRRRGGQRSRLAKTLAQYDRLPRRSQAALENVAHAITRMREGFSLKGAATEYGVAPRTVVRLGGSALRKNAGGRYAAKASDNLLRVLKVPVHGGEVEVAVRGSRAATAVSNRLNAQRHFAATGDDSQLRKLKRAKILDASGREVPFLTDLDELERLGDLG
jgi:hypothetical protein